MPERTPIEITNLDIYGSAALPWSRPQDVLAEALQQAETAVFLSTVRPDGRPHTTGIGAAWLDGELYFTSGPNTRKARNLAVNPACTIACRLPSIDLTLEGEAQRVVDQAVLEAVAKHYRAGGWPAEVADDALTAPYSAPSAGPPPWHVYRVRFNTAVGVATAEPNGATRWRFEP